MSDVLNNLQARFDALNYERAQIGEIMKQAFMAAPPMPQPAAMQDPSMMQGGMPPGAPPMDPSMMQGQPPMDPAMMGGQPPMDPSMMGGQPPMDPAMMQGGMPPGMDPAMMGAPPADPAAAAGGGAPPMDPQIVDQLVGALEDLSNQFMSFAQETQTTIEQLKQEVAQQEEAISGFERQLIQLSADAAAQAKQPLSFG
jgi:hypothetical protein